MFDSFRAVRVNTSALADGRCSVRHNVQASVFIHSNIPSCIGKFALQTPAAFVDNPHTRFFGCKHFSIRCSDWYDGTLCWRSRAPDRVIIGERSHRCEIDKQVSNHWIRADWIVHVSNNSQSPIGEEFTGGCGEVFVQNTVIKESHFSNTQPLLYRERHDQLGIGNVGDVHCERKV